MVQHVVFVTDTAALVIFDPFCLKHRLDDAADWWTLPANALQELKRGTLLLFDLGSDGVYELDLWLTEEPPRSLLPISFVQCSSGKLFVGPGELITAAGFEPVEERGSLFVDLEPGAFAAYAQRDSAFHLSVWLARVPSDAVARSSPSILSAVPIL